jgi:hypothetical protein
MPDTTRDESVRVLVGVGSGVRVWCTVGVTFKGDGRHSDDRSLGKSPLEVVVLLVASGQAQPPTVIVDDDADMIRVVQRCRAAIERRVIEIPLWRSCLPDELGKSCRYLL